ncbi:MAG TPA: acetyl-CoA carboxylase, carboxyltransferase subunit beta [Planctomycetota bacterium]|nr:acetyl-CoA carboxylase, carboxyltransferase subunit beta [Planctomycetota bacterium]HRR79111.1 acetyl-CoA carboxylase, carboxyltransferase subunit beta [Planctomycetota bacterium]HRT93156.1 acetyl-CoA carboxylase, carboxyltransferase subunit beta [Planctomycetota bacterium]
MPWMSKRRSTIPDGLWMKCDACGKMVYKREVEQALWVCPKCQYHFSLTAPQRIRILLDEGSFQEADADIAPTDPLKFVDRMPYAERLREMQQATGLKDAVVSGRAKIDGRETYVALMDSRFIMASMGSVVGEKITRAFEHAAELRLPIIIFCASGGARMQEGCLSLMQMIKTSAAARRYRDQGGVYIAVLTNPTYAGVMASFASLGDIIVAEPKALIGFTGARVIQQTLKAELPPGFQTAEFMLEHGFLDRIIHRKDLRRELALLLDYCKPVFNGKPTAT